MYSFSEYVSIGHPDKIADYISEYLLDEFIKQDPETKYAVEVQVKDNFVTLGGEISSLAMLTNGDIDLLVRKAVDCIGYDIAYRNKWGGENTICSSDLKIDSHISIQSSDIAQGVINNEGWGDQGIFYGYAVPNKETCGMPYDYTLARRINHYLFTEMGEGLDIKTEIILDGDNVKKVIIAIPISSKSYEMKKAKILKSVKTMFKNDFNDETEFIINGTGKYVAHSSIADCGTTGRKLAVDFYGGNCKIGGGSPWTKDGTKADLTLNLYARYLAKKLAFEKNVPIEVSIACCIGQSEIYISAKNSLTNEIVLETTENVHPRELIEKFKLNTPIYASMCTWGLFGEFQKDKEWEKI